MEIKYYTRKNIITAFIVGLIIGLGVYYLIDNRGVFGNRGSDRYIEDGSNIAENDDNEDTNEEMRESENTVSVSDQPAGMRVNIARAVIAEDGWVVVYEDSEGLPGNILGAQRFDSGTYQDVVVDLLRNTEEGGTYYAILHTDDGDREFDFNVDVPVVNILGSRVMDVFEAISIR